MLGVYMIFLKANISKVTQFINIFYQDIFFTLIHNYRNSYKKFIYKNHNKFVKFNI